ncbi:MAG: export-related protein chaperone CsaA [Flaviaesturariibacter sp.]|nr:export-related protein chaperone CsaA [Flaviaesturariibacter sp.]
MHISWDDFEKIDIRTGRIEKAEVFESARKPAFKLWIDFGPEFGQRRSSAQITAHYTPDALVGKTIVAVVNFPPKQIANFFSECLVLGVYDENNDVVLLAPDRPVAPGQKIG